MTYDLANKKIWVASSTHLTEEIFCARAHIELKKKFSKIDILILCNGKSAFSSDFSSNWKEALNSNFQRKIHPLI